MIFHKPLIYLISASFLLISLLYSCTSKNDLSTVREVTYSGDISGILSAKCGSEGCHGGKRGEGSLIGYSNAISYGEIKPGDARGSKLYKVITGRGFDGISNKMPPSGSTQVSDIEMTLIYVWIEQGAKNN
jgi:hypothetical protein